MVTSFADGAPHKIRIKRTGDELRLDVNADNTDDLICTTRAPKQDSSDSA